MHWVFRSVAVLASASLLIMASAVALAQGGDLAVAISPVGGSGVSATANLTAAGNQTNVTVSFAGLTPGSTNETEIHFGTCANTGGIEFSFPNVVANAAGNASLSTTVNASLASLQDGNHLIHTHLTNAAGNVLACGNIPAAAVAMATNTAVATATQAAVASATAVPSASATAVAAATAVATATPAALPVTGDPGLPVLPLIIVGAAVIVSGFALGRSTFRGRRGQ
jgi:hypothetical protein